MVERQRGEKSYVRIARSSKEQNGYERHRTRPVPVSSPRPITASGTPPRGGDAIIRKNGFWFQEAAKKFLTVADSPPHDGPGPPPQPRQLLEAAADAIGDQIDHP